MSKIKRPPPRRILEHLIQRFHDGRIKESDLLELKEWMEATPDVPEGKWFKRFKTGILAGKGEMPLTFLSSGMAP